MENVAFTGDAIPAGRYEVLVKVYHANSHENIKYKVVVHAGKYVKLFDGVISATSSNGHGAGVLLVATFSYDPQTGITDVAGGATGGADASSKNATNLANKAIFPNAFGNPHKPKEKTLASTLTFNVFTNLLDFMVAMSD